MTARSRDYTEAAETDHELTVGRTMVEAIAWEVCENEEVFYMGEDVADYGGVFSSTTGLLDEFGRNRVMGAPINETTYLGAAVGAAQASMRPITESMFVDFFSVAVDQIYNNMTRNAYMNGGSFSVPMMLTTAVDGTYNDAGQHSQTLCGTFAHLPGMKVVVPSTAYGAKGLIHAAIHDDNSIVYMFHKHLMGLGWIPSPSGPKTDVFGEDYVIPFGEADAKRPDDGVTIVILGLHTHRTMEAAERLGDDGIDAEVIDLRTLMPLDTEMMLDSVRKTGKLLVVDEDYRSFDMTGKIIAQAAGGTLDDLSAIKRLAIHDVPIPYAHPLEGEVNPGTDDIAAAVRELYE